MLRFGAFCTVSGALAALLPAPPLAKPVSPTGFVSLKNGEFFQNGSALHPFWATFYPYWKHNGKVEHGGAWADPAFPHYIDKMLSLAHTAHINTLRASDFLDGAAADWRNPTVWANMDYFVKQAAKKRLHVVISLDAYRKWLIRNNENPYSAALWQSYLRFFCSRYANAADILYIPIAGEVPPPLSKNPWKATAEQYLTFYRQILTTLKRRDPHHLHSVGGLSFLNNPAYGIPWQQLFSLPGNNLADIHVYSQGDLAISLPMVGRWCAERKMPFVLEEFGARQSLGDGPRAAYFQKIFSEAAAQKAAGIGFWNLGPELAPTSYEVNENTPLTFAAVQKEGGRERR